MYLQRRPNAYVCARATARLEAAKDDYRIHCEELEKQLVELQHRNDELTSLAEESRALKDELDVLRFVFVKQMLPKLFFLSFAIKLISVRH